jgi:nitroimidazol reductase NimA-like FMN-containing flavoprotein (pyridoxamine 5'-phosphate oxidase superfamily)
VTDTEVLPSKFTTRYKSVVIFGTASEVTGELKKTALQKIIEKYSKDYLEEGIKYIERAVENIKIVKISIEHITGKANI